MLFCVEGGYRFMSLRFYMTPEESRLLQKVSKEEGLSRNAVVRAALQSYLSHSDYAKELEIAT